jgi:hypothetical protein
MLDEKKKKDQSAPRYAQRPPCLSQVSSSLLNLVVDFSSDARRLSALGEMRAAVP